jgi:hypothetical protein
MPGVEVCRNGDQKKSHQKFSTNDHVAFDSANIKQEDDTNKQ